MDTIRTYLRELRKLKNISQRELAEQIGMSLRGFSDYELGKTEGLKGAMLIQAVVYLDAAWSDLIDLSRPDATEDEAIQRARFHVEHPPTPIPAQDEIEISQLTQELLRNPHFRNAFLTFWSGWKAHESVK